MEQMNHLMQFHNKPQIASKRNPLMINDLAQLDIFFLSIPVALTMVTLWCSTMYGKYFILFELLNLYVSAGTLKQYELTQKTGRAEWEWRSTALTHEWRLHYGGHDYLFREVKVRCQVHKERRVAERSLESQIHLTLAFDVKLNKVWCTMKKKGSLKRWIAVVKSLSFLCTSHTDSYPHFLPHLKVVIHCVSLNYESVVAKLPIKHYPMSIMCYCSPQIVIQMQQDSKTKLLYVRGVLLKRHQKKPYY